MSYDYLLVRGAADNELETLVEGALSRSIGSVASVKAAIDRLFPSARWRRGPGKSWSAHSDQAQITFLVEADDEVRMLHMSHCERAAVTRVVAELGLTVIDEQSLERFGG
jgi:hypothetical protein